MTPKILRPLAESKKIYSYIKENTKQDITSGQIKDWLRKQEVYTLHRPVRRKFKRPVVIASSENYQWDTDTANMNKYKEFNQGYGYFAVFIDIFTRYLYTYPMKTLTGVEMVQVIEKILKKSGKKQKNKRNDQGSEYVNRQVKKLLIREGINHIYTFYETKANYAERVIKTIKLKITKYLSSEETFKWVDKLQNITFSYNNSKHRTIKMTPIEAQKTRSDTLWSNQYKNDVNTTSSKYNFKIGDKVKISYLKKPFDREYSEKWSTEIFTVMSRKKNQDIPVYQLKDYNNEVISGYFYEPEMQISYIGDDVVYKVEKILKKHKRRNITEVLVKWKGWGKNFNSWIPEYDLQDIKTNKNKKNE